MGKMTFPNAIESALAQAMAEDPRIVVFGEDVPRLRRNLFVRFGRERVLETPISEGAFVGSAVAAAKRAKVDLLVTLDKKHLLGKPQLIEYIGFKIVTPQEAMAHIRGLN